jgi:hypothetical protein
MDPDPRHPGTDPDPENDMDPYRSGSATLVKQIKNEHEIK